MEKASIMGRSYTIHTSSRLELCAAQRKRKSTCLTCVKPWAITTPSSPSPTHIPQRKRGVNVPDVKHCSPAHTSVQDLPGFQGSLLSMIM